jgi:hypothetical protein
MAVPANLAHVMNAVADSLGEPGDLEQTLMRITRTARDMVPRADYVSISIRHRDGHLETVAPTDPVIAKADELQYSLREGPCYDVLTDEQVTYSGNLATDDRWPTYGPRASQMGFCSQLAMRLHTDAASRTGLNLYSRRRAAFGDSRQVAEIFVSHAQVALGYAEEVNTLMAAIATRKVIGEAIGVVIERNDLDEERAFEFLMRVSQDSNVKLRDVAAQIVEMADDATNPTG